ncbi:ABC transporter ATP-binding protein [Psychrobacillus sp. OK032]|uniref:ABC transporter ATP-binding protein n=1 Tax=Psychrobacillus sp. OK032 TaxID=1884358 RepID=UPI0008C33C96|nr:ABC transporter ATP-binding protein [Psychrobacillus sp. OK032]SES35594.1 ABC-2 type transport system ATP-binding protein [Psychrobacillus sp. OK032]
MTKQKVLSLTDVTMSFGNKQALNGVNLEVYQGQIIGYIGPNGAGKSTTVKIMLGLIEGYKGEIEIFGEDIANGDVSYKRKIGYVPETAELYDNLTACEYLTFTGELYGLSTEDAQSKAMKLMNEFNLETVFHQRLSSYSKGMKQKVLIISSLLHDPDLLFFDEPLSGLDANSVMIIKEILDQLAKRGKTIFYSSHIMDVVEKISNRIILLVEGRVVADGTFEELQAQSKEGTLEEIFNQLTGFSEHKEIAEKFVEIVSEGKVNG